MKNEKEKLPPAASRAFSLFFILHFSFENPCCRNASNKTSATQFDKFSERDCALNIGIRSQFSRCCSRIASASPPFRGRKPDNRPAKISPRCKFFGPSDSTNHSRASAGSFSANACPVFPAMPFDLLPVIHAGAFELRVVQLEAERLDQMQHGFRGRAQAAPRCPCSAEFPVQPEQCS